MSTVLDKARLKEISANARGAQSPCLCGCGTLTSGRFAPGHDAKLKQQLRLTAEEGTAAESRMAEEALDAFGW